MAILAECDICGNQHRVKDGLVGSSIRCKDCGVTFVIPPGPVISPETYVETGGRLRLREPNNDVGILWPRFVAGLVVSVIIVALVGAIWVVIVLARPILKNAHQEVTSTNSSSVGTASSGCAAASFVEHP